MLSEEAASHLTCLEQNGLSNYSIRCRLLSFHPLPIDSFAEPDSRCLQLAAISLLDLILTQSPPYQNTDIQISLL